MNNKDIKKEIIDQKRSTTIENPEFNIAWTGKPSGLGGTILSFLHLNFTKYQISKDELIIVKGFFSRKTDTIELYLLKDPDLTENIFQRMFKVGTITVTVDSSSSSSKRGEVLVLKDIKNPNEVRKLLRDYIEADIMERGINYIDKV